MNEPTIIGPAAALVTIPFHDSNPGEQTQHFSEFPTHGVNDGDPNDISARSFADEFKGYGKVGARSQVRRCSITWHAKAKGRGTFEEFCQIVGLDPSSSTVRKYLKIGREAEWLELLVGSLPSDWTTIYHVALIGPVLAQRLIEAGVLHPEATAKQSKASEPVGAVRQGTNTLASSNLARRCVLKVVLSEVSDQDSLKVYTAIERAIQPFGLKVSGLPTHLAEARVIKWEAAQ